MAKKYPGKTRGEVSFERRKGPPYNRRHLLSNLARGFASFLSSPSYSSQLAVRRISNPNLSNERARPLFYDGYSTYGKVEAHLNPIEQRKNTTILRVGDLPHLVQNLDGFKELYEKAQGLAGGLTLLDMHVLQQSSAQAIFSWHHDCEQVRRDEGVKILSRLLTY